MFESIWEDLQREFRMGNMITRLILVNVAVYVFINLLWVISGVPTGGESHGIYETVSQWLSISSDWYFNLTHPWVIFTNMFLHQGFMHILFNMLFLYWFGRIVGDLVGDHRILPLYILGGLCAGLIFYLSANFLPYGQGRELYALGASGSVMAVVAAAGILAPDYIMRLILIGDVKLKYIVAVLIFIDIVAIGGMDNTGGHFAHLGGAAFGWLFVTQLRQGNDLSITFNKIYNSILGLFSKSSGVTSRSSSKQKTKVGVRKNKFKIIRGDAAQDNEVRVEDHQEQLDKILEKIKQQGFDNLSAEEKEFLANASNK